MSQQEFFTNDVAIICAEIRYSIGFDDYTPSDLDFSRKLWSNPSNPLNDLTFKVEGKEIKVSYNLLKDEEKKKVHG